MYDLQPVSNKRVQISFLLYLYMGNEVNDFVLRTMDPPCRPRAYTKDLKMDNYSNS